jgi:hypothetical protein
MQSGVCAVGTVDQPAIVELDVVGLNYLMQLAVIFGSPSGWLTPSAQNANRVLVRGPWSLLGQPCLDGFPHPRLGEEVAMVNT